MLPDAIFSHALPLLALAAPAEEALPAGGLEKCYLG
jgi:hypothetical protein